MENKNTIKVLIVDDEKVVRDLLVQLLATDSVRVMSAENGPRAIEMAKKDAFDLVFLDVRMPEMGGLEAFRELKKLSPDTEYVMMTGYAVDDILAEAKKEGVARTLKKPFDLTQVKRIVEDCMKSRLLSKSVKILVIDDEDVVLTFFKRLLNDAIYDLATAKTGKEAMECLREKSFDLIFLDTVLEDIQGKDLYVKIQEIRPGSTIVLITGYIEKCDEINNLGLNIKGCLYKPFEIDKIYEQIEDIKRLKGL